MVASKQSTLRLKLSREVEKKVKLVGSARLLNFHISCYWGKKKTVPPFITEWSLPGQVNKKSSTCNIITNNNHIENKFNINIFLNEKCKDAINKYCEIHTTAFVRYSKYKWNRVCNIIIDQLNDKWICPCCTLLLVTLTQIPLNSKLQSFRFYTSTDSTSRLFDFLKHESNEK